jgi:N-dimethylarginine dimethylaminohydrolase
MIPIKGYATFHPLKHCWIGSGFRTEWFEDLDIAKNDKIMSPLKRIAEETEEDYQTLEKILKAAGVQTYRSFLDIDKVKSLKNINRPPVNPRDHFAVIGEKLYAVPWGTAGFIDVLKNIQKDNIVFEQTTGTISTATICRVGKDIWWDINNNTSQSVVGKYKERWTNEGFRVHISNRGYHSDASFCVVRPGCIVSLRDIQNYETEFPGWDVLYLPDQSWSKVSPFLKIKEKVGGRWWLKGEEHNNQLIDFVNTWLSDWVGFIEETVFDVNMLSIDENTIICNNYNKEVFDHFKKHRVEPIVFNFRHRYFWDGGIHCITQDLYREGEMEDYFG